MAAYLNTLRDEILTLVGTTWADAKANGLYRSRELALIPWERKAPTLPVAVIDLDPEPTEEYGLDNRADLVTVRIYRIVDDAERPDTLMTKLEAMRTALWPDNDSEALSAGQVVRFPRVSDSLETTVNEYFLGKGLPFYSGMVEALVLVGTNAEP